MRSVSLESCVWSCICCALAGAILALATYPAPPLPCPTVYTGVVIRVPVEPFVKPPAEVYTLDGEIGQDSM